MDRLQRPRGRRPKFVASLRASLAALKAKARILAIFPEGRMTTSSGREFGEGKDGAALIALKARVPVIPAYISGDARVAGSSGGRLIDAVIHSRVVFGRADPIPTTRPPDDDRAALAGADRARYMDAIKALQRTRERARPARPVQGRRPAGRNCIDRYPPSTPGRSRPRSRWATPAGSAARASGGSTRPRKARSSPEPGRSTGPMSHDPGPDSRLDRPRRRTSGSSPCRSPPSTARPSSRLAGRSWEVAPWMSGSGRDPRPPACAPPGSVAGFAGLAAFHARARDLGDPRRLEPRASSPGHAKMEALIDGGFGRDRPRPIQRPTRPTPGPNPRPPLGRAVRGSL